MWSFGDPGSLQGVTPYPTGSWMSLSDDVGFPSVGCEYVLLPLVSKEAALANGRAVYSKVGNPSRDRGGKKMESSRLPVAAGGERCQNLTGRPHPCGDTQISRNGLI